MEIAVSAFLILEASQSNGTRYRLVLGWHVHPKVASVIIALSRLF
jgi:hypothetical protein